MIGWKAKLQKAIIRPIVLPNEPPLNIIQKVGGFNEILSIFTPAA